MKYAVSVCLAVFLSSTVAPSSSQMKTPAPKMAPEKAEKLRAKYASGGIIRDMDHIREDLKHLIELTQDGVFSTEESIFYLMRMHDFDDNNQVDGLELIRAFGHAPSHEEASHDKEEMPLETLEILVDGLLEHDSNADGYLSFAEWVKAAA